MITKKGLQFYQLGPLDGFGLRVSVTGAQFDVVAGIDVNTIDLQSGQIFAVTPQMLSGAGSLHEVRVVDFFLTGSAANARFTIDVLDASGATIDHIVDALPAGQTLPFNTFHRLLLHVV